MKTLRYLPILLFAITFFSSCNSAKKISYYIKDYNDTTMKASDSVRKYKEPLIQKNDLLSIFVYSEATDEGKTDAMYNLPTPEGDAAKGVVEGYLVDNSGNILFPRIGTVRAEGLTKAQLADIIEKKINEKDTVLTNPSVIVKLLNFRVTVLGDVTKPGPVTTPGEKLTILEAIGLAGDVTVYGKKDDVIVARDVNGKIEYGRINLSSRKLYESPYYYLQQNDVVFVNPEKNKAIFSEQLFNQRLSITLSVISIAVLIYTLFK